MFVAATGAYKSYPDFFTFPIYILTKDLTKNFEKKFGGSSRFSLVGLSTGGGICLLRFCSTSWTWEPSVTGECQLSCQLQHKEAFEKRSEMKIDMVSPSTFDRDHRHGPE